MKSPSILLNEEFRCFYWECSVPLEQLAVKKNKQLHLTHHDARSTFSRCNSTPSAGIYIINVDPRYAIIAVIVCSNVSVPIEFLWTTRRLPLWTLVELSRPLESAMGQPKFWYTETGHGFTFHFHISWTRWTSKFSKRSRVNQLADTWWGFIFILEANTIAWISLSNL